MAYKIKIDDNVYSIKDGFTIKEELNETLDSGIVEFNLYRNQFNKVPFDKCLIYDDEDKIEEKHLMVDKYDDEIFKFANDPKDDCHQYILSLFSQTKELERITIPNKTTTQSMKVGDSKRSVWYYIYNFCNEYLPKIRVYDEDNNKLKWVNKYKIDPAVSTKFNSIDCPEFQWNNPTLREVLNDLMSTADCIVIIKEDVISYYDLRGRGNAIDREKLSLMKRSMNSGDYVSELSMYMQNAIGKHKTTVMPFQTLRTADATGRITTLNCAIVTQTPIYSVKKLTLWFFEYGTGKVHKLLETDRVLEYDEWQLLSSITVGGSDYYNLPTYRDSNGYEIPMHRVNFLYYKRGGYSINNMGVPYATTGNGSQNFATLILKGTAMQLGTAQFETKWYGTGDTTIDPRFVLYELEYETMSQHAMNIGKYLPTKHPENRIFDSQDNSYVDVEHQSIFEYAKVNRLGNKIIEIYGEYKDEDNIPKLGDYLDNSVLFSRELTYYDDIIYFKGFLTENYVLRDYFTSVRARKRSWQIASEKDALTSHSIFKFYVETSFKHKEEEITYINSTLEAHEYFGGIIHDLSNIYSIQDSPNLTGKTVSYCMVQTNSAGETNWHTPVAIDCNKEIQGNSLCFNFGFNDNFKSSDFSATFDVQSFYEYADSRGEYTWLKFYISYTVPDGFLYNIPLPAEEGGTGTLTTAEKDSIFAFARFKPQVVLPQNSFEANNIGATEFSYIIHKDNREISRYSLQFEYCSDTPDIVITPKFIEYIRMNDATQNKVFPVYISTTEGDKYALTTKTPLGNHFSFFDDKVTFTKQNGYSMRMQITDADLITNIKSIGIADNNGDLLIGINASSQQIHFNTIYFNLLQSRDCNVYFSNEDRYVLGDISDSISTIANRYNQHAQSVQNAQPQSIRILRRNINKNDLIDIGNE